MAKKKAEGRMPMPAREPRRWVTTAEAMRLLGVTTPEALDRRIEVGDIQCTVQGGVHYVSGAAIDERLGLAHAPAGGEPHAHEGLSQEEMSLLSHPVLSADAAATPHRSPSGQDLAESLPRVLEPYLAGLHEKIDGLSAQVNGLTEAIDRRPEPEPVHAEVIRPDPHWPAADAHDPAPQGSGPDAGRLFETIAQSAVPLYDPVLGGEGASGDYAPKRSLPRTLIVLAVAGLAALAAAMLLLAALDL
jgi:hypothetical protein